MDQVATEHKVKRGEYLSLIANKYKISLTKLLSANPRFKADPNSVRVGDVIVIPAAKAKARAGRGAVGRGSTLRGSRNRRSAASSGDNSGAGNSRADKFKVDAGQLTFDAEGMETPGKYFSRKPHVPGAWSGVTIGRGYDMGQRSADEIIADLTAAGVPLAKAKKFSKCRGLKGARARKFLRDNNYTELTITPPQQKKLFEIVYAELAGDVRRICAKQDVVAKYGETKWDRLDPLLRDIAVDLRYRGDYTGATRERVQPVLVANDLVAMRNLMSDKDYWVGSRNVPVDRFKRRRLYLVSAQSTG